MAEKKKAAEAAPAEGAEAPASAAAEESTAVATAAETEKKTGGRRRRRGKAAKEPKPPKVDLVRAFEQAHIRQDIPEFRPGDTVRVWVKIVEGNKERLQAFEGICIARKHGSSRETFMVRKISAANVGVERTFFLHSKRIDRIERTKRGVVRRAKIYFLRDRVGKHARIRERRD